MKKTLEKHLDYTSNQESLPKIDPLSVVLLVPTLPFKMVIAEWRGLYGSSSSIVITTLHT